MSELIVNPEIPYIGTIPSDKLEPGKMCRIQGITRPDSDRFNINLQTGPTPKPRDDTALHISIRINQGYIARNSYTSGTWGDEEGTGKLPIGPGQSFEILILTDVNDYKVAVNGEHFCDFAHRIALGSVSHLLIDGDVTITLISWEHSVPLLKAASVSQSSAVNTGPPQQFNYDQGFPPNAYQPQGPQGPYNGPPQYGPSQYGPPQYGPPVPPGAQPESGSGGFLEQAQDALVGAIKSGAAQKLLSGLLSTGDKQGYAPQNAKYGIYPQLPVDENALAHNTESSQHRGPLETFLSGLLSNTGNEQQGNQNTVQTRPVQTENQGYPNNPQYPATSQNQDSDSLNLNNLSGLLANLMPTNHDNSQQTYPQHQGQPAEAYGQYPVPPQQQTSGGTFENLLSGILPSGNNQQGHPQQPAVPQIGGQGSMGGLGSMGGILSNLAGQILHNPKDDNRLSK